MRFKFFLLVTILAQSLIAQDPKNNPSPFNKETLKKNMSKLTKNENWQLVVIIGKLGLLGTEYKKELRFKEKFSNLNPEQQQEKIEKWLAQSKRREKIAEINAKMEELQQSKKLDDETVETALDLHNELQKFSPKELYLCEAYGPAPEELSQEDQQYLHDLRKRTYFHALKKRETIRHQERIKELNKLERQALNDFTTLNEFLDYDNWNNRRAQ